jgi:hypothetical protein
VQIRWWYWLVVGPFVAMNVVWAAAQWYLTVIGLGAVMLTVASLLALALGIRWGW